jgi:amino acid transporter
MFAMARSGLFPKLLTKTRGTTGVPYMAFLMGSLLSLIILVVAW